MMQSLSNKMKPGKMKILLLRGILILSLVSIFGWHGIINNGLAKNFHNIEIERELLQGMQSQPENWPLEIKNNVCDFGQSRTSDITYNQRNLGVLALVCGQLPDAKILLERAHNTAQWDSSIGFLYGAALFDFGDQAQAFEVWNAYPEQAVPFYSRQVRTASLDNDTSTVALWLNSMPDFLSWPLSNDWREAYLWACIGYRQINQPDKAQQACKLLLKQQPEVGWTWMLLGNAYITGKNFAEAENAFKMAIKYQPEQSPYYYGLGQAYEGLGQSELAWQAYLHSAELSAEFGWAQLRLAELELERNNPAQAVIYLRQVIDYATEPYLKKQALLKLTALGETYP